MAMGLGPRDREALAELLSERIASGDFARRLQLLAATGWCARPVRLAGHVDAVDRQTGEARTSYRTYGEPDNLLLIACGNRRASVCPSCAWTYAGDTFQLVAAGLRGGTKGVPEEVATHPRVLATLTAPSFGAVHSRSTGPDGRVKPCHPRDQAECPHSRLLDCRSRHAADDAALGRPICPDCYDHAGARGWNAAAPKLWHRFTTYLPREIGRIMGLTRSQVREALRPAYVKVAELQARGLIHFHAVIRADGPAGPESAPPEWCRAELLAQAARAAAGRVVVGDMRFGEQIEVHVVEGDDGGRVAAYIAKYASKGTAHDFADVGFPGHFSSKSRAYSTTLGSLREARAQYRRGRRTDPWGRPHDDEAVTSLASLGYAGTGHLHPADALIARTNAELARKQAAAIREARQERPTRDDAGG
jgi:hypothetical protein